MCCRAGEGGEADGGGPGVGSRPGFPLAVAGAPQLAAVGPRGQVVADRDDGYAPVGGGVDAGDAEPGQHRCQGGAGDGRAVGRGRRAHEDGGSVVSGEHPGLQVRLHAVSYVGHR
jgi:hypothetical protein